MAAGEFLGVSLEEGFEKYLGDEDDGRIQRRSDNESDAD
jgi:hypothetical protein